MYRTIPAETNPPIRPRLLSDALMLADWHKSVRVEFIRDKWSKSYGLVTSVTVDGDGIATITVEATEVVEYVPDKEETEDSDTEDTLEDEDDSDE